MVDDDDTPAVRRVFRSSFSCRRIVRCRSSVTRMLSGEFSWTKSLGRFAVAGAGSGGAAFCVGDGLICGESGGKTSKYCGSGSNCFGRVS